MVSNAELSGIGKRVAVPSDLPPPGKWDTAAINILVLRNDTVEQYPDLSALLSALTMAAINRTNNDPARAEKITAAWVFGDEPILTLPKGLCTLRTGSTSSLNDLPQSRISSPSISPTHGTRPILHLSGAASRSHGLCLGKPGGALRQIPAAGNKLKIFNPGLPEKFPTESG